MVQVRPLIRLGPSRRSGRRIRRALLGVVRRRLRGYPAVTLVGPRQCGKTTLARGLGGHYFDLEQEPERLRLDLQWEGLESGRALVVLDEAQAWPEVFSRLRSAIDRDRRRNGRFLLLGSVSPAMMSRVSESLAGRLALVELAPFSLAEVPKVPLGRLWHRGGYPEGGVLEADASPSGSATTSPCSPSAICRPGACRPSLRSRCGC